MSFVKKLYKFLSFEANKPRMYGIFHVASLLTTAFLTTFICKRGKLTSEETERKIAKRVWIVLLALETYKQLLSFLSLEDNVFSISYGWMDFPFQLCSAPLYVLPLIAFLPSGKVREAFVAFFGTFVLLGGIAVCIYPGNVFVETLGINAQTMLWHGSQVVLGIYFNLRRFYGNKNLDVKKYFKSALPIFLSFAAVALILNVVGYFCLSACGIDDELNLFFISPYFECIFPVLKTIQAYTPYPVFLFSYIAILSAFSYALLVIENETIKRILAKNGKNETKGVSDGVA